MLFTCRVRLTPSGLPISGLSNSLTSDFVSGSFRTEEKFNLRKFCVYILSESSKHCANVSGSVLKCGERSLHYTVVLKGVNAECRP